MKKTIERLQKEYADNTARLQHEQHRLQRLENRIAYLESGSRKRRAHRLITRGAAVESVLPEIKVLTEQEFYSLMECVSALPSILELVRSAIEDHGKPPDSQEHGG